MKLELKDITIILMNGYDDVIYRFKLKNNLIISLSDRLAPNSAKKFVSKYFPNIPVSVKGEIWK